MHGWAIAQRIQQISDELLRVQQGSLYPALHRLEHRGWLAASWARTDSGRDARVYRLTPKGRRQLDHEVEAWARLSEAIRLILQNAG
jgi:transcriptional regulator